MFILGLVGRLVGGAVRGGQDHTAGPQYQQYQQQPYLPPPSCNCRGRQYCPQCAYATGGVAAPGPNMYEPAYQSRHDARRESHHERRAVKAARKAARRGYGGAYGGYPPHPAPAPAVPMGGAGAGGWGPGYPTNGPAVGGGYGYARDVRYDEDAAVAGPSSRAVGLRPQQQDPRRASFDARHLRSGSPESDEDEEDLPPKYERGNWQAPRRTSVEVLTDGKRSLGC